MACRSLPWRINIVVPFFNRNILSNADAPFAMDRHAAPVYLGVMDWDQELDAARLERQQILDQLEIARLKAVSGRLGQYT